MAYNIACIQESASIDAKLQKAVHAARTAMDSTTMPVLLEGVLLVGNYVNSSSRSLGRAVGVSLESLAKLAHTRGKGCASRNAFTIIIDHLQQTHPSLVEMLLADLDCFADVQDIDPSELACTVQRLS